MRRLAVLTGGLALVLTAAGCATKPIVYGPRTLPDQPWGYEGKANPDGGHTVLFVMPGGTPAAQVKALWERRAGEVCPGGIAKSNIFRADHPSFTQQGYAYNAPAANYRVYSSAEIEGYVYCKPEAAKAEEPKPAEAKAG